RILADESSSLSLATNEYKDWLPQVVDKVNIFLANHLVIAILIWSYEVAALVHHTYDFPSDSSYTSYISSTRASYPNKQTWMSEICCSLGNADGSGRGCIKNALMFSGLVFQSLVVAGESHYDFWTLVSNGIGCSPLNNPACIANSNSNGWTDGVIYYDDEYATNRNYQLYITKHFWTYKHFGNFVK
ncbi:hypothetical protein MPER_07756, partial [Moniliophthora perniciosa FA553]